MIILKSREVYINDVSIQLLAVSSSWGMLRKQQQESLLNSLRTMFKLK